ncbi:DNA cytosine methyltransferase [Rhizobium leguminosarum]|uniref:DNA cytosine methyltransferase n=1 Tax=Rhizobium leguminosarum TaxID=384 RepID=UPI0019D4B0C6|nr:DNA cytosine methyltransferase [Rhizobium leguminosarum]
MECANDNVSRIRVLDLFSAAAGGWSLGMHRAGYRTIAACEVIDWRRALYSENNPGVPVYDDVTTLTADRLIRDGIGLPDIIVGSPPCQDISSANTKGKGVDGERSGLYFEAVRLIDECRPRWFALENSANLRTRGADRVIDALAAIGYTCWPFVVSAGDVGANHERKRSWLIGFRIADANSDAIRQQSRWSGWASWASEAITEHATIQGRRDSTLSSHPSGERWETGAVVRGVCPPSISETGRANGRSDERDVRDASDAGQVERRADVVSGSDRNGEACERPEGANRHAEHSSVCARNPADANEEGQKAGLLESSLRPPEIAHDGCCDGWSDDGQGVGQMGGSESTCQPVAEPWADWNGGLAHHLRVDDGLSGWVAQSRIAVGGPKGTVAASLIVEAFGDAVCPQIPEAIGRAILRVEMALAAISPQKKPAAANDNSANDNDGMRNGKVA